MNVLYSSSSKLNSIKDGDKKEKRAMNIAANSKNDVPKTLLRIIKEQPFKGDT